MQKTLFVLLLCTTPVLAAENPETLAERSQARARKVIDAAVAAIGGREALQGIRNAEASAARRNVAALANAYAEPSV